MAQLNFNAATVAPDTGRGDPIPAGWYNVMLVESEMKPTKDGTGAYLACAYKVIDGQHAGRQVFHNLNLRNSNPTAQEIAFKQLSAICHAVGVIQVQDSAELHGKPLKVKVKIRVDKTGEYEPQNEITSFKNINEQTGDVGAAPQMGMSAPTGFGAVPVQQMPAQQPWQQPQQAPVQQIQQPVQQPQQFQQPIQQPMQQPMQQPAQAQQAPVQYQQPVQQQQPQQAPMQAQQPWEQAGAQQQQPWAQPQPQQQPVAQPQYQQPVQQQAPAQQNPAVQQFAQATPPWQQ